MAARISSAITASGERDALRVRQTAMLRILLRALLLVIIAVLALNVAAWGSQVEVRRDVVVLVGLACTVVLALFRLNADQVGQAVGLVVTAALSALAIETLGAGIAASPPFLFSYAIPIVFAGLLLGRRALLAVAATSITIVVGVHLLEQSGATWVGTDTFDGGPDARVIVFTLVIGLLTLALDRFAVELKQAHRRTLDRQVELSRAVSRLEREIEERKQVEAAREQSEERLAFASEAVGMATWTWDLDRDELVWSEQLRRLLDVPSNHPPSLEAFWERVHPDDLPALDELSRDSVESGESREVTFRLRRENGVRWVTARFRTLPPVADRGAKMVGVIYDVTERKESEEEREELLARERQARGLAEAARDRLSFLAEASHLLASSLEFSETLKRLADLMVPRWADWSAVDMVNEEGVVERLSVAHEDPTKVEWAHELQRRYPAKPGRPSARTAILEGKTQYLPRISDSDLVAAARDEEHLRILRDLGFSSAVIVPLVVRGEPLAALTLVTTGERYYTDDDVLFFEELAARAAVAVDNSKLFEQIRMFNQELERRVELRTAELRDALGELETFAYSVSHDLRAPLRGIDGFSQALLEDYGERLDGDARQYLDRIRAGARRMGELIDDILSLSRLSQGQLVLERVDLTALAEEILMDLREKDPQRRVDALIAPSLAVRADSRLLRVAMENILGNAWKFTSGVEKPVIEVGKTVIGDETVFFVRDNGIGFEMAYSQKLFAPFQRLHPADQFEGSGIGLATAQRVLRRHGGRIWASSVPGEGAVFYFTLGE